MMRGDLSNLATRSLFRAAQPKQGTDLVERKTQFTRASNENQDTMVRRVINPAAAGRAGRRRQQFDPFVIADGFNIYPAALRELADRERFGSRRRDGTHEIVLDPVVTTGCTVRPWRSTSNIAPPAPPRCNAGNG